ncbi:MAG: ABC transporter substrate-binding protein [Chitinophagaceae bacterium]
MKILFSLVLACFACMPALHAQDSTVATKPKIAIFAPLYLDSAFDATNEYRYAKTVFPKFINPGLEFYEGAQLALDSLAKEGSALEVFVYDTRSAKESLEDQLKKPELADVKLIIAHCSSNEVRLFAEAALKRNIPVINTTIPNDGGVSGNPYFIVLNPTLRTQCEGIYKYIQKYYATRQVVVFRKKGVIEDQIKTLFDDYSKTTASVPLKLKYVDLIDSFTVNQLKAQLDSNRNTVCIAGTLDAAFGRRLAQQLASISKSYPMTLMGMPTWDGIRDFTKPEFNGLEIIYANPFYNPKSDKISQDITAFFNNTMYARPSDMVFRGYEVTWKFAKLLMRYGNDLASNLGDKANKVFTDFDIQPVLERNSMTLQYFENKKLYFLKWQDGLIKGVN